VYSNTLNCLGTTHKCDGRTDRQSERQTDRQTDRQTW